MAGDPAFATPFIGRDEELKLFESLLARVACGRAEAVLVQGEAGIGKSHLLLEVSKMAEGLGFEVCSAAAHELERSRPFGALADALSLKRSSSDTARAAIAGLLMTQQQGRQEAMAPPGAGPDVRFLVVEHIVELLESLCGRRPVMMLIEDL